MVQGLDAKGPTIAIRAGYEQLEAGLAAAGFTPESVAEKTAQIDTARGPLAERARTLAAFLDQANAVKGLELPEAQRVHVEAALAAAEALNTPNPTEADALENYNAERNFLTSIAGAMRGLEEDATGYSYRYKWDEATTGGRTIHASAAASVRAIRHAMERVHDVELKTVLESHIQVLEQIQTAGASKAVATALNEAMMSLIQADNHRPDPERSAQGMLGAFGHLVGGAEHMDDEALSAAAQRFMQLIVGVAHLFPEAMETLFSAAPARPGPERLRSVIQTFVEQPDHVGDPADLFLSQGEIMDIAEREGGMISDEQPERPNISSDQVKTWAERILTLLLEPAE